MQPNTLAVIQKVWAFRAETKIPCASPSMQGPMFTFFFQKVMPKK